MIKRFDILNNSAELMEVLNALGDRTRQEIILFFYKNNEACVTDIAENFSLSRPTISHHLNLMRRSKILNSRKEGKEIYYSFNRDYVVSILENLTEFLKGCC